MGFGQCPSARSGSWRGEPQKSWLYGFWPARLYRKGWQPLFVLQWWAPCRQWQRTQGSEIQGNSIGFKFPGYFTRIWNRVIIHDDAVSSKIWRNYILFKNKQFSRQTSYCCLHWSSQTSWKLVIFIASSLHPIYISISHISFFDNIDMWMTFQLKQKRNRLRGNKYLPLLGKERMWVKFRRVIWKIWVTWRFFIWHMFEL